MTEKWSKLAARRFFGILASRRHDSDTAQVALKEVTEEELRPRISGIHFYISQIVRDRLALAGLVIVAMFIVWGAIEGIMQEIADLAHDPAYGWLLLPSNPILRYQQPNLLNAFHAPNLTWAGLMGTDNEGLSIFSQILYATPHDVEAALIVVFVGIFIGMLVGIVAGYAGGIVDEVLMRITDAFLAIPGILLLITVALLLGASGATFLAAIEALIIVWWPTYARFFRSQTLTLKNRSFVEAARLSGVSPLRILFRHIFPNSIDPIIAYATLDFGTVILTLATLAFLGIGVQAGYPEWGYLSSEGAAFLQNAAWWPLFPGLVILVVVVGFTLLGDKIQDLIGGRTTY